MEKPYLSVRIIHVQNPLTLPDSRHLVEVFSSSSLLRFSSPFATSCYPFLSISFSVCLFFSSFVLFSSLLLHYFIPFSSYSKFSSSFVSYSYILFLLRCFEPHSYAFKTWKGNILWGGGLLGKKLFEEFYCCPLPYLVTATLRDHYVEITNLLKIVRSLKNYLHEIVTYRGDYRRNFGLDDWIYYTS
jgi:hypothetical protein